MRPVLGAVVISAISVVLPLPARAAPSELPAMRLSTTRMENGGSITASGTGCAASQVQVVFNRGYVAFYGYQTPDETGSWSQSFERAYWTVPGWSPGHFTVNARCQTTPEEAYPDADFVALPEPSPTMDGPLQLSADAVQAGESITLTGTFAPQYDPTAFLLPEGTYLGHVPAATGGDFTPTVYELTVQVPTDAAEGEHTIAVFGNEPGDVYAIRRWALGSSLTITAPPPTTTAPATTLPSTTVAPTTTSTSTTASVVSSSSSSTNTTVVAVASGQDNQGSGGSTPWGAIGAVAGGTAAVAIGLAWWRTRRRAADADAPPVEILDE